MNSKYPTNIILDSSVIAKWFFPSEEDSETALKIRDHFLAHEISVSVPLLIYYEINNLLRTAIKRFRISEELAKEAYVGFLELELVSYSSRALMVMALENAISLDISSYDASYIALSKYLEIPFITADQKLVDKAKTNLVQNLKTSFG